MAGGRRKTGVVLVALAWLLSTLALVVFYDKAPINSVTATTERVLVRVASPTQSTLSLAGLSILSDDPFAGEGAARCMAGTLIPAPDAIIEIVRIGSAPMRVSIRGDAESAGAVEFEGGRRETLPAAAHLVANLACGAPGVVRVPIWGAVSLGDDMRGGAGDPGALLLDGEISVSARSISLGGLLPRTLYHVTTLPIPVGSRVSETGADNAPAGTLWAGFVEIDPAGRAMQFRAQTEARNLKIFIPGQDVADDHSLRVGLFVPLFEDPYLLPLQVVFASFLILLQASIQTAEFLSRPPRKGREAADPAVPGPDLPPMAVATRVPAIPDILKRPRKRPPRKAKA